MMKTGRNTPIRPIRCMLALVLLCAMLALVSLGAHAEEYTQLTKKTFAEVAKIIDGGKYTVFYYDDANYTEVGYITGANNPNWYYIGPKGSVSISNNYYNGKSTTYYYGSSSQMNLYYKDSAPDKGAQSFTVKATGLDDDASLTVNIVNPEGKEVQTVTLNAENSWTAEVSGLGDGVEYTVEATADGYTTKVEKTTTSVPAAWTAQEYGEVEADQIYAFTYTDGGKTYLLGGSGSAVVTQALAGSAPEGEVDQAYLWKAIKATSGTSYGKWLLQNQGNNYYLAPYNGYSTGYTNAAVLQESDSYYGKVNLHLDDDGSIWNGYNVGLNLYATDGTVKSDGSNFTEFTPYTYRAPSESVTYAITATKETAPATKALYVRLVGSFDSMIVGQQSDVDAISSSSTSGSYSGSEATAYMQYALVDANIAKADVPEESWHRPDYFKNGGELQIDGTKSKVVISPEGSGMELNFNIFDGGLILEGTAKTAGTYQVSVVLTDSTGRTDTSNALDFKIFTGDEALYDLLVYDNCKQTADGKYMYDMEPWYVKKFGGPSDTVTVPVDVKAWYGSHGVAPTISYGELGKIVSLTNGEQPTQTLIIPSGCNLTMVNMRVHSGVKIIVEEGAKLTIRETILEGIVEVHGTFSMDYNDFGDESGFLHGSSINGQLRLKDGAVLENARIVSHSNYSARDDESRENYDPIVTVDGNVTLKGDAYILGDEAPTGEAGQPGLKVNGTLNVPEGSTLAVYGGGSSFLTANGGDAIIMDGGEITGAGNLIAVGGYGMNITADESKGNGGAAVSGDGRISVAKAYLEGGSSFQNPKDAIDGDIAIADTTHYSLVKGQQGNETSPQYWHGTGDANGTIPDVAGTIALVPENAPAGVSADKTSVSAEIVWTDGAENHAEDGVAVSVNTRDGQTVATETITAEDAWKKTVAANLEPSKSYTVSAQWDNALSIAIAKGAQDDAWDEVGQLGNVVENETYLISYEYDGKTYILGAQGGVLGSAEWSGQSPKDIPDGFKWRPVFANDTYGWYLMNQGVENGFLSMRQSGWDYTPAIYEKGEYSYYYALIIDEDGSLWSNEYGENFLVDGGKLTTSGRDFTKFTFHRLMPSQNEHFVVTVTPKRVAAFTAPEAIEDLAYSGEALTLVTGGSTDEGTMVYILGEDGETAPEDGYTGEVPTGMDAGTYHVWYRVNGDKNHLDTAPACIDVTIDRARPLVTAPVAIEGLVYSGDAQSLVTGGSTDDGAMVYALGEDGETAPEDGYTVEVPTGMDAGTYHVWYRVNGDKNHLDAAPACVDGLIGRAEAACDAPMPIALTYTGDAQVLVTEGNTHDGTMLYSLDGENYSEKLPSGTEATTYKVYYKVSGDANHNDTAAAFITVTIAPAESAANEPAVDSLTYNGDAQPLVKAGTVVGGEMQYALGANRTDAPADEAFKEAIPTGTEPGEYFVWYRIEGDANHNNYGPECVVATISKASIEPSVSLRGWTYGETPNVPVVTGNDGDAEVTYLYSDATDGSFSEIVPTVAGTWYIKAEVAETQRFEGAETLPVSFAIARASITITANDRTGTCGEAPVELTYQVTGNHRSGDDLGIALDTEVSETSDPGKYAITVTWNENANYVATLVNGTYTVRGLDIAPVVSIRGWTYGEAANAPRLTGNPGGGEVRYTYAVRGSDDFKADVPVNAGAYTVKATVSAAGIYNGGEATASFTIAKATGSKEDLTAAQKPTATGLSGTGAAQPLTTAPVALPEGYTGAQYSVDGGRTWSSDIPTASAAGSYDVRVKYVGDANHEDFEGDAFTVTIGAGPSGVVIARMVSKGSKALKLTWTTAQGVEGYDVFLRKCGDKAPMALIASLEGGNTDSHVVTGLRKGIGYTACVRPWVMQNGVKTYVLQSSPAVHAYTNGGTDKRTNPGRVIVKKTSFRLTVGRSASIRAKVKGLKSGRKILRHTSKLRYVSSDTAVATVSAKGRVTAVGKGSCVIYVLANNGVYKTVRITVD